MAMIFESSPDFIADAIAGSIRDEIERELRRALTAQAQPIIDDVAKKLAAKINAKAIAYRQHHDDSVVVTLVLNNEKIEAPFVDPVQKEV